MSRRVNQVQCVFLVFHPDRLQFDGDAPFPLQIHGVEKLFLHFALFNSFGDFQHPVGEGRFSVVYMGNDTKVSDIFHML